MIRRPPISTRNCSSAASDVYKRQVYRRPPQSHHWNSGGLDRLISVGLAFRASQPAHRSGGGSLIVPSGQQGGLLSSHSLFSLDPFPTEAAEAQEVIDLPAFRFFRDQRALKEAEKTREEPLEEGRLEGGVTVITVRGGVFFLLPGVDWRNCRKFVAE